MLYTDKLTVVSGMGLCLLVALTVLPLGSAIAQSSGSRGPVEKGEVSEADKAKMSPKELSAFTHSRVKADDPTQTIDALAEAVRSKKMKDVMALVANPDLRAFLESDKCFKRFVFGKGNPNCDQVPGQLHLADVFAGDYELGQTLFHGERDVVEITLVPATSSLSERVTKIKRNKNKKLKRKVDAENRQAVRHVVSRLSNANERRLRGTEYVVCRLTYRSGWRFVDGFCDYGMVGHFGRQAY